MTQNAVNLTKEQCDQDLQNLLSTEGIDPRELKAVRDNQYTQPPNPIMTYTPKVNDYVIWERHGLRDEGWVYFVSQETENQRKVHRNVTGISRLRQE